MVKVDKNTLSRERGKYVRLCIQVNLIKLMLVMFSIKGRYYKVEYEGLHLLCRLCGRFGHSTGGCTEFKAPPIDVKGNKGTEGKLWATILCRMWIILLDLG